MGRAFRSATVWGSVSLIKYQNIVTPEQCWRHTAWSHPIVAKVGCVGVSWKLASSVGNSGYPVPCEFQA